jgi:hypothetical protein
MADARTHRLTAGHPITSTSRSVMNPAGAPLSNRAELFRLIEPPLTFASIAALGWGKYCSMRRHRRSDHPAGDAGGCCYRPSRIWAGGSGGHCARRAGGRRSTGRCRGRLTHPGGDCLSLPQAPRHWPRLCWPAHRRRRATRKHATGTPPIIAVCPPAVDRHCIGCYLAMLCTEAGYNRPRSPRAKLHYADITTLSSSSKIELI